MCHNFPTPGQLALAIYMISFMYEYMFIFYTTVEAVYVDALVKDVNGMFMDVDVFPLLSFYYLPQSMIKDSRYINNFILSVRE